MIRRRRTDLLLGMRLALGGGGAARTALVRHDPTAAGFGLRVRAQELEVTR
ncbi:hypothetical protein ACIA5G_43615 [Amycolatopsis sp. NPDC051758]|uniref:hypothetical protein n=1 Tax=Amycolatopsis sp. NPDC051758 TaxID=3363935 RepID=UPI0037AD05FB